MLTYSQSIGKSTSLYFHCRNCVVRYERVTDLKAVNPDLKVLLSVGGLTLSTKVVSTMLSSWETRDWFIVNAITYLRYRNFDGLDLALQRLSKIDKRKFALLCNVRF